MGESLVEPDITGAKAGPGFSLILDTTANNCKCADVVPLGDQAAATTGRNRGDGRIDFHCRNVGRRLHLDISPRCENSEDVGGRRAYRSIRGVQTYWLR